MRGESPPKGHAGLLIDVLHAAPRLAESLPSESLSPLAATCTSMRALVYSRVTTAVLTSKEDVNMLSKHHFPNLSMIVISITASRCAFEVTGGC